MFGNKNPKPQIDKEQLELIENAQKRIKQKKRLYVHFIIFLIGSLFLFIINILLGIGKTITLFEYHWYLFAILIWAFFLVYHFINVFITHKFMGKTWEREQLEKLVAKQQMRIEKLKNEVVNQPKSNSYKQEITIIVAAAENDAIGKGNQLIWHLSNDLKRFKNLTNGHHIIMGRKTFESFPKPLPNRTHVVITRQNNYKAPEGVIIVNTLEDAIDASKNDTQPFIIGGGEIYKQAMSIANKIELTRVHHSFDADTYFPKIDTNIWKETANTFHKKDENHDYEFSFITYMRK